MRLVEMGVEPFLVTSALDCVVAQRLARKLCDKCKEPYQPTEAELVGAGWPSDELEAGEWPTLQPRRRAAARAAAPGYRGRFGIHEVLTMSEEIERLIIERRSSEDIQKVAVMQGMFVDALRRPAQGRNGAHLARGDLPRRRLTPAPTVPMLFTCRSSARVLQRGACEADTRSVRHLRRGLHS